MTSRAERWAWRAFVLIAAGAVLAAFLAGRATPLLVGSVVGSSATDRYSRCLPGHAVPILNSPHVSEADAESANYNSLPPTSGPHFAFTVAPGVYTTPIAEGLTVHAMEHGHVIIQYGPGVTAETVRALRRLARSHSRDVVLAPYPKLDDRIALTAWGRIDTIDEFDEPRIEAFIEKLRNRYSHGWTRKDASSCVHHLMSSTHRMHHSLQAAGNVTSGSRLAQ